VDLDAAKRAAALRAADFIRSGSTIGLGTGSTVAFVLEEIAARLRDGRLSSVAGVPTSDRTARAARALGIPLATLDDHSRLDLTIDGADEIDPALNLIKGLGGALLREKIVGSASDALIIVADATKLVPVLGTRAPVPVEVVPFAAQLVRRRLERRFRVALRASAGGSRLVTDEGHWILDCFTGPVTDPGELDRALHAIPGVVEHGLFLSMATKVIVADAGGVSVMERT
jgi:ribose 5-phosphate isomerase A